MEQYEMSHGRSHGSPIRKLIDSLIVVLVLFGLASSGIAILHQSSPLPAPPVANGYSAPRESTSTASGMVASTPVSLRIPAINVTSPLAQMGLNADGSPSVPRGVDVDKAAWLTSSVTPGQVGTAVIVGHVDTVKSGPSVFFRLGDLAAGDTIDIGRQDGATAVFSVDSVRAYNKTAFPSSTVYGRSSSPVLRLITCTGDWDASAHQYTQNLVVFASLTAAQ